MVDININSIMDINLNKDTLESIDMWLREDISRSVITSPMREKLLAFKDRLHSLDTEHSRRKNKLIYHIERVLEYKYKDYSELATEKQRIFINSLVKEILELKGVLLTNIPREYLDIFVDNNVETIDRLLEVIERYNIEYNIYNILESRSGDSSNVSQGDGHKGGGGVPAVTPPTRIILNNPPTPLKRLSLKKPLPCYP